METGKSENTNLYNRYTSKECISSVLAMIIMILSFLWRLSDNIGRFLNLPLTIFGIALFLLVLYDKYIHFYPLLIIILSVGMTSLHYFLFDDIGIYYIFRIIFVYTSLALYFLYSDSLPLISWTIVILVLWGLVIFMWVTSPDGYILFYNTSRNYISLFSIFFCFILTIVWNRNEKDLPTIFCIGCFLMSIWAIGRGGIIASSLYLILFLLNKYKNKKNLKQIWILLIAIAIILILLLIPTTTYEIIFNRYFSRFIDSSTSSSNEARIHIYTTYFNAAIANPKNFLFGLDTRIIDTVIADKGGNLHNSFLQAHSLYGFFGLLIIVILTMRSGLIMHRDKQAELIIVVSILMLRCMTDCFFPGDLGDIIIWYVTLLPFKNVRAKNSKVNCR